MTHPRPISSHYPPLIVSELCAAAAQHDLALIDRLTDYLAADGLARKRSDMSQLEQLRLQCSRVRAA